jgi:hypothetical protein
MRVLAGSYVRIACTIDDPDDDSVAAKHVRQGKQQKLDLVPTRVCVDHYLPTSVHCLGNTFVRRELSVL